MNTPEECCTAGGNKLPSKYVRKFDRDFPDFDWESLLETDPTLITKDLVQMLCLHHLKLVEVNLAISDEEMWAMTLEERAAHARKIRDFLRIKPLIQRPI